MPTSPPRRPVLGPSATLDLGGRARREAAEGPGAEWQYLNREREHRTVLLVRLRDGLLLRGTIEWHDRTALRLNLLDGGHRVVPRTAIATIAPDATAAPAT